MGTYSLRRLADVHALERALDDADDLERVTLTLIERPMMAAVAVETGLPVVESENRHRVRAARDRSSSAVKSLPKAGLTPSIGKKLPDTSSPVTCSVRPAYRDVQCRGEAAEHPGEDRLLSRKSRNIAYDSSVPSPMLPP